MRSVLILAFLFLSTPELRAQATGAVEAAHEVSAPAAPGRPAPASDTAAALQEHLATEPRAADPILDAGFWRSVLAGVIVTVVSALILRAIL